MSITKCLYIYEENKLPKHGWIQGCFNCASLTSNTILFHMFNRSNYTYECYTHICKKCKKKMNNTNKLYQNIIDNSYKYLYNNYYYLLPR